MNPQEKAKELVEKMFQFAPLKKVPYYCNHYMAKQCALIAVDEMLEFTKITEKSTLTICTPDDCFCEETTYYNDYLIEVKQEIEAL
jgi:hypothetical protein